MLNTTLSTRFKRIISGNANTPSVFRAKNTPVRTSGLKFLLIGVLTVFVAACGGGGGGGGGGSAPTLQSIAVTPQGSSVALGATLQLAATGTYSDSTTQDITTSVSWSSSDTTVATVGASTGVVTPAAGATAGQTVVITATSGTLTPATTTVTVVSLSSIAVTPNPANTALNAPLQLTATGTYSDSSTKNITTSVTWSSGDSAVATVGPSTGLVTPATSASPGQTVVITATSGALTGTTTVTLTAATFSISSVTDPLAVQQWGLKNTGQNGYADTAGVANTSGTLGTDINADFVYSTYGYTGKGVIVGVVDTGLEIAHEDLSANVVSGGSWNFLYSTTDPTNTVDTTGDHGTMVSGLIAMAMNGIGGIGVAPNANLEGFNFLQNGTPANEIASLGGSTASPNSSNVFIFNQSFGTSNTADFAVGTTLEAQYASGTSTLRGGKGALYVKSAGNGFNSFGTAFCGDTTIPANGGATVIGISCQNANFDASNTLPYNIVMAALNAKGKKSSYSTTGSAIWASTPGGEYGENQAAMAALGVAAGSPTGYDPAMVTTDQSGCTNGESWNPPVSGVNGGPFSYFNQGGSNLGSINLNCNYTNGMNGTSSAAPMMSGTIALILEANPALTWREVKDILAKTAVQVDAAHPVVNVALSDGNYVAEQGWVTNVAGHKFSNWYGFGAVDAKAAVDMAKTYVSGSLGTFADTGWIDSGALSLAIADNSVAGVSTTLTVPAVGTSGKVEAVQLQVTTSDTGSGYTGDLGIELTSPSGTKSILKNIQDGFSGPNLNGMVLESNAFYGESSSGSWTVKVLDGWAGGTETLTNVKIRVYGH